MGSIKRSALALIEAVEVSCLLNRIFSALAGTSALGVSIAVTLVLRISRGTGDNHIFKPPPTCSDWPYQRYQPRSTAADTKQKGQPKAHIPSTAALADLGGERSKACKAADGSNGDR